jgi:hypothetical protein
MENLKLHFSLLASPSISDLLLLPHIVAIKFTLAEALQCRTATHMTARRIRMLPRIMATRTRS